MSNMFNTQGELNAASVKDALEKIVKYAAVVEQAGSSATLSQGASLNDSQRDGLIKQALESPDGKIALGQAMANPIRRK